MLVVLGLVLQFTEAIAHRNECFDSGVQDCPAVPATLVGGVLASTATAGALILAIAALWTVPPLDTN
ncbi:hypothetical protein [Rhodococcus rhodochrous]|uniref:hypothetical protein n=1 Tax=Rhodococcus rhodochrous TaxID=1829 RepID=UPI0006C8CC55|nr:hypothetical protein [Rhodococcus rhodochrous]